MLMSLWNSAVQENKDFVLGRSKSRDMRFWYPNAEYSLSELYGYEPALEQEQD